MVPKLSNTTSLKALDILYFRKKSSVLTDINLTRFCCSSAICQSLDWWNIFREDSFGEQTSFEMES